MTKKKPEKAGTSTKRGDVPAEAAPTKSQSRLSLSNLTWAFARLWITFFTPPLSNAEGARTIAGIKSREAKEPQIKMARKPHLDFLDSLHILAGKFSADWMDRNIYGFPVVAFKKALASTIYALKAHSNKKDIIRFVYFNGEYNGKTPFLAGIPEDLARVPGPFKSLALGEIAEPITDAVLSRRLTSVAEHYARPSTHESVVHIPTTMAKPAMMAYRGEYWPTSVMLDVRYLPSLMSLDDLVSMMNMTGESSGIGSWRHENGGTNGLFRVMRVAELPQDHQFVQYPHHVDLCGLDKREKATKKTTAKKKAAPARKTVAA